MAQPADLSQLDPALKATYDRVMGTDVAAASAPPTPTPQPLSSAAAPVAPEPIAEQPAAPTPQTMPDNTTSFTSPALNATGQHTGVFTRKQATSLPVSTPILIAGGFAALVGYAVIWMKVFGIF